MSQPSAVPTDAHERIDLAAQRLLATGDGLLDPWLLLQNQVLAELRRQLVALLALRPGDRFLDAGCGYGVFALDVAAGTGATCVGVDVAADKLATARALEREVRSQPGDPLAPTLWVQAELARLALPAGSVQAASCQFVFQHLPRPLAVAHSLARVLAPGGRLVVVDVDDGLDLDWPPRSASEQQLGDWVRAVQAGAGGDRFIGRKLPTLLTEAGLQVVAVQTLVQAGYGPRAPQARAHLAWRCASAREAVLAAGLTTAEQFDRLTAEVLAAEPPPRFSSAGQVACLALRTRAPG